MLIFLMTITQQCPIIEGLIMRIGIERRVSDVEATLERTLRNPNVKNTGGKRALRLRLKNCSNQKIISQEKIKVSMDEIF